MGCIKKDDTRHTLRSQQSTNRVRVLFEIRGIRNGHVNGWKPKQRHNTAELVIACLRCEALRITSQARVTRPFVIRRKFWYSSIPTIPQSGSTLALLTQRPKALVCMYVTMSVNSIAQIPASAFPSKSRFGLVRFSQLSFACSAEDPSAQPASWGPARQTTQAAGSSTIIPKWQRPCSAVTVQNTFERGAGSPV